MKTKNKLTKLFSFLLSFSILFGSIPLPTSTIGPNIVYADSSTKDSYGSLDNEDGSKENVGIDITQDKRTSYSDTIEIDNTQNVDVYVSQSSSFGVFIPKTIILDGKKNENGINKANYLIKVSENTNIAGTEKIQVVPDSEFKLTQLGKNDINAIVVQDKQEWLHNEIDILGNGEISSSGMTAGAWKGVFNFNIFLSENNENIPTQSYLLLSKNDVKMSANDSVQVNAFIEGENVNELVDWNSNNENITVTNGLVETKAAAQPGDSAVVTVSANLPANISMFGSEPMNEETLSAQFNVTIIDMAFTSNNEIVTSLNLKQGESVDVEATIIPASANSNVTWTSTAVAGLNLVKNGNKVTIKIADDMPIGNTYNVIASLGDFSKLLEIKIISDHEHIYKESIEKEPTCSSKGITKYTCECGDNYILENIDMLEHNYESVVTEPTCEEKGYTTHTCSVCGDNYIDSEVSALGHTLENVGEEHIHTKCSVCGEIVENHDFETSILVEPTCNKKGTTKYSCACGYSYELEDIEELGHDYESVVTDPTCANNGFTTYTCKVCGDNYVGDEVSALGHNYEEESKQDATCVATGLIVTKCSNCGDTIETILPIDTTNHNYSMLFTIDEEATCVKEGSKSQHCLNDGCDSRINVQTIPIIEHKLENGKCIVCNYSEIETYAAGLYDTNYTLIHDWNYLTTNNIINENDGVLTTNYNSEDKTNSSNETLDGILIIDESILEIGDYGFVNIQNLEKIYFPSSLEKINYRAFESQNSSLNEFIVSSKNENFVVKNNALYSKDLKTLYAFPIANGIKEYTIENGTTTIGSSAFAFNKLEKLIMPNTIVNVEDYAFYKATTMVTTPPNSLKNVGSNAFWDCYSMSGECTLTLDSIGKYSFGNYNGDSYLNLNVTFSNKVTIIPTTSFQKNINLTIVNIPNSVENIDTYAFSGCKNLQVVNIPESVTNIGKYAFANCTNMKVILENPNNWYIGDAYNAKTTIISNSYLSNDSTVTTYLSTSYKSKFWTRYDENITQEPGLYDANDILLCSWEDSGINIETDYTYSTAETNENSAYYVIKNKYPNTRKVVIPNGVTKIGAYMFNRCSNVTSVLIPNTVTSIGTWAFGNTGITNIRIPNGVTTIPNGMLSGSKNLVDVYIPDSVTYIDAISFVGCTSLLNIYIPSSVKTIRTPYQGVFEDCSPEMKIYCGASEKQSGWGSHWDGYDSENITYNFDVFFGCTRTDYYYWVNKSTSNIETISIPEGITIVPYEAFRGNKNLTSIELPTTIKNIDTFAFYGCSNLNNITIPANVTRIGNSAFASCTKLTSITIPSKVTNIGSYAFLSCTNLSNVIFDDTTTWYVGTAEGATTTQLYVANSATAATYLTSTYSSKFWTKK